LKRNEKKVYIISVHKTQLKCLKIQRSWTDRRGKTAVKDVGIYTCPL